MSHDPEITPADLMAHLDGDAAPETLRRVDNALAVDAGLAAERVALGRLADRLEDAGRDWRTLAAPADLAPSVLEAVRVPQPGLLTGTGSPLETELEALGAETAGALPTIDVLPGVMAAVAALRTGNAAPAPDALLEEELAGLGAALRSRAPSVDVETGVLNAVRRMREDRPAEAAPPAPDRVVPFPGARRPAAPLPRRQGPAAWQVITRLAAVLLVMFGLTMSAFWFMRDTAVPPTTRVATRPVPANPPPPLRNRGERVERDPRFEEYSGLARPIAAPVPIVLDTGTDRLASLSMEDALAAFQRDRARDPEARARLNAMGSLTEEEARRLLEREDLSLSAYLGALQFLPSDEAAARLREAVGQYPEDPQMRYLLARTLAADPETRGEALEQIAALNALASDNSLGRYMEAQMRLESGDVDGALASLAQGMSMESADAFGLADAQNRGAALAAAGVEEDLARFLAYAQAGRSQYAELTTLGDDLMAQGAAYEEAKDYETAAALYEGVQSLGEQVVEGAEFANEQLAGMDLQMSALDALVRVTEVLASPGGVQMLEAAYSALAQSLTSFLELVSMMDASFAGAAPEEAAATAAQALVEGDPGL